MQKILILFGLIFLFKLSYSQDTLQLDKRVEYYSANDTIGILDNCFKNIYSRADYARELIKYSDKLFKLEFCFYFDNKRYIHYYDQIEYRISNDTILNITYGSLKESWIYKKLNDSSFFLKRAYSICIETGFAKTLIPLEKVGEYTTFNINGDTLWTTNYLRNYYPIIKVYEGNINDTIFDFFDVNPEPEYNNNLSILNQPIPTSSVNMPIWDSCLYCTTIFLSAIIDKNGFLQNIKIIRSCGDAYFEQTAMQKIARFGQFPPGIRNGKKVNIRVLMHIRFDWNN